jgi:hypothetical protein
MADRTGPQVPDQAEIERRKRERAEMEDLALRTRQRPAPTKFATEVAPQIGEWLAEVQSREDQRIVDERAGLPTKPFGEMDYAETVGAMASYDEPKDYPLELEERIQRSVNDPPAKVSRAVQAALLEIVNIRQRAAAGQGELWMIERLRKLSEHRSSAVKLAAATCILEQLHPIEEMKPTREFKPKKARRVN